MLKLIKDVWVYAPEPLGKKDVLLAGKTIIDLKETIELAGIEHTVIQGKGKILIPGLIDSHVHITGGGGEAGFASKTPEVGLEDLIYCGITTVIGVLGTDGFSRNMENLISKAKALKEEGMSAYVLTGSYQIPVRTLTGSIEKDIMIIDEIIGVGEVAINDHRSSQPTKEDLKKVIASSQIGGLLSKKGGVTNVHLGGFKEGLSVLDAILSETPLRARKIVPTHVNRSEAILDQAITYSLKHDAPIDFTTSADLDAKEDDPHHPYHMIKKALKAGVSLENMTFSSDAQGSLPIFNAKRECIGMGIGQAKSLFDNVKKLVENQVLPLEKALKLVTTNVQEIYGLKNKGKIEIGYDADLVMLDQQLTITDVFVLGNHALDNHRKQLFQTFRHNKT